MPPADPPRVAVEAVASVVRPHVELPRPEPARFADRVEARSQIATLLAQHIVAAIRALPDADRWRLIGWLAEGLEPTREMLEGADIEEDGWRHMPYPHMRHKLTLRAMLDAAREGGG